MGVRAEAQAGPSVEVVAGMCRPFFSTTSTCFGFHGGWEDLWAPGTVSVGEWQLVAASFDGTTLRLYVDGVLRTIAILDLSTGPSRMWIGYRAVSPWSDWNNPLRGAIGEIRLYSRVLSDEEIEALYLM